MKGLRRPLSGLSGSCFSDLPFVFMPFRILDGDEHCSGPIAVWEYIFIACASSLHTLAIR